MDPGKAIYSVSTNAPGTFVSCYLQMFYVVFLFPWLLKHFEN